jgi:hypothetical protein
MRKSASSLSTRSPPGQPRPAANLGRSQTGSRRPVRCLSVVCAWGGDLWQRSPSPYSQCEVMHAERAETASFCWRCDESAARPCHFTRPPRPPSPAARRPVSIAPATVGVFVRTTDGDLDFHELPEPSPEQVAEVAARTANRVERLLNNVGKTLGERAGQPALRLISAALAHRTNAHWLSSVNFAGAASSGKSAWNA